MNLKRIIALLLVLLGISSVDVFASRKTDVATLYNGDRITGEIKSLSGGILEVSTDAMGTLNIEWQEISRLESEYYYEIRLSSGQRYFGSLQKNAVPGQLQVLDLDGEQQFDWLQVVEMRPIAKTVLDRVDAYFSAGYSYTRANSVQQGSISGSLGYENEKGRNTLSGRASSSNSNDRSTSSSRVDLNRAVWTSHVNQFRATFASYETNDELALDYRLGVGAGFGRYFIDNFRYKLAGIVGLQVITEESSETGSDQNIELYLSSKFSTWRFKTPELNLDYGLNLYPSLTDSGRLRGSSDLRLRWELIADLFFDITAWASYDNKANTNSDIDYGLTTGLGWSY